MFGYGCSSLVRSTVLFCIGKMQKDKVMSFIQLFLKYFMMTMISYALLLFLFSRYIARLFFSDPQMITNLSNCIKIYAFNCTLDIGYPVCLTLFRIVGINTEIIYINFCCFALPFNVWLYFAIFKLNLEFYSPIMGLFMCNFIATTTSVIILWKNFSNKLYELKHVNQDDEFNQKVSVLSQDLIELN